LFVVSFFQTGKAKIPLYNTLNIQLKGYDFPVLENYQKLVHKIAEGMDIEVEDGYVLAKMPH
jgi:large subunit ribosomal protein L48